MGLTEDTLVKAEQILEQYKNPALLVSFGKDSMAMLHLLRHLQLPVICHRDPWQPWKWEFADSLIRSWKLRVYDWPPEWTALQEKDGDLELVSAYGIGDKQVVGIRQQIREEWGYKLCGLHDCLSRPRGAIQHHWDLLLSAQKNGDTDHFDGHHEITLDLKQTSGADIYFPFRNWTDEDVWNYTTKQRVPFHNSRYRAESITEERDNNPDLIEGCFACLRKDNPSVVRCPRLNNAEISNIANQVPYVEHNSII